MELKTASQNFIKAGKDLVLALARETDTQYQKNIKPQIDGIIDNVHRAKVKRDIDAQKPFDVERDTSKRKYHRGG
jgi:hypothetical protein